MATFQSLEKQRLQPTLRKIQLLGNLARYDHTELEARRITSLVNTEAMDVQDKFSQRWGWGIPVDTPEPVVTPREDRAALPDEALTKFDLELVAWALDATRYDPELARGLLRKVMEKRS